MGPQNARAEVLRAPLVLLDAQRSVAGGGLLVRAGRIERVLGSAGAVRRAEARCGPCRLGDELQAEAVLAPGLVDAHAHLELSALAGRLRGSDGFVPWVRSLVAERARQRPASLARRALQAAHALLAGGTTSVGDIDATGAVLGIAAELPLRTRLYREVLDAWDPARTSAGLARVRRALPRRRRVLEGLAPHAPYTTSAALLAGLGALARRRRLPVTVHWAETEEEGAWLERGEGPWRAVLPASPRRRGLALLEEAGLLGTTTSLVHGNHPARGEPEALARHGVVLVHCPGTHAFFGRAPFPWRRYARAGVVLALGTDSLASNETLDLRREMALARAAAPWLAPRDVFAMATVAGARAIGLAGEVGRLAPGCAADVVAHRVARSSAAAALEELTSGAGTVLATWVGGRRRAPARP